jgi:hypothetical protein
MKRKPTTNTQTPTPSGSFDVWAFIERTAVAQGFPAEITDPLVLDRLVAIARPREVITHEP